MNTLSEIMVVGLTGQTGAGKSTVSKVFEQMGFAVINADTVARMVAEKGSPCLREIEKHFGSDVINPDNTLNRKKGGISPCPYKLRAKRMVAGRHSVNNYKPDIALKFLDRIKQRNSRQKEDRACRYRNKSDRKNAPPSPLVIKREAENTVGNTERDYREKQISRLGNEVCRAVIRGG